MSIFYLIFFFIQRTYILFSFVRNYKQFTRPGCHYPMARSVINSDQGEREVTTSVLLWE